MTKQSFIAVACLLLMVALVPAQEKQFTVVNQELGLEGLAGGSVAWVDFDGDGWVDLYTGRLWKNNEGKKFTLVEAPQLSGPGAWADIDNDGDADFFHWGGVGKLVLNQGEKGFEDISDHLPDLPTRVSLGASLGDFNSDGFVDIYVGGYEGPGYLTDVMYFNNGDTTFREVWRTKGTTMPARGITSADYDEDGDLDIYVSNYRLVANSLWQNDGEGIFTDGTMNNAANARSFAEQLERDCLIPYENDEISREECEWRLSMLMGGSYGNAVTNVAKLWDSYPENEVESEGFITYRRSVYAPGAGTKTGDSDVLYGAATGMGEAGVIRQVSEAFSQLALRLRETLQGRAIDKLTLDLFGFSRGAAAARHAAHEINLGRSGRLAQVLEDSGILWPEHVQIRFVGIFDSVAAIVNPLAGDLLAHNDRNYPVKLYLDPGKVGKAVHLTAAHEHRKNFALNSLRNSSGSLPENFKEITLPGVHSDIGGGYSDSQREEVLLSPMLQVPQNRIRWPEKTVQWDNLEALRREVVAEGWIGPYCLPVQQADPTKSFSSDGLAGLEIATRHHDHPAPNGRAELGLRMLRQIRGEYSRIPLRLMHRLAVEKGVPLDEIDPTEETVSVPAELEPILQEVLEQVSRGLDSPSLDREQQELLLQRYIHYSAHFNSIETLIAGVPSKFEGIYPHAPSLSRERTVYPQMKSK